MNASISQLIVNSPFEEPSKYWSCERQNRTFNLAQGAVPLAM
jgi:type III restriction enzyme